MRCRPARVILYLFVFCSNILHFLFFIAKKEKKTKQKKRNNALFSTTLRLWIKLILQAVPALFHSLMDARGAKDVLSLTG